MNLASDTARRAHIQEDFSNLPDFALQIVPGIAGNTLPDTICQSLTDHEIRPFPKGTLGCFLSHVAAWEKVATLNVDYAVVLEDDVELLGFGQLKNLSVPADAGIVFINERLSVQWGHSPLTVIGLDLLLLFLDVRRQGLGGDGYLLRPDAARKLIAACKTDLFRGHVDGRLLRYAVSPAELEALPEESWIKTVIIHHHDKRRLPQLGLLKGYALSKPLVRQRRGMGSSRLLADAPAL
jgi:GR25 family glycosyltransferase involved in LPS biosynthesis